MRLRQPSCLEVEESGTMTRSNKYNVSSKEKRTFYGIVFDSKKEMEWYIALSEDEKQGKIQDLKRQVPFTLQEGYTSLQGKKIRPITYKADYTFYDTKQGRYRVIDCKGYKTEKYLMKKKIFDYVMLKDGIYLEEV